MNFYEGKHVIVTGGAGFIGHQLVKILLQSGAKVTVLDDFSRGSNEVDGAVYFKTDVTNFDSCKFFFSGKGGDYGPAFAVFNLAAKVAGVLHNMNHHLPMYYENVKLLTVPVMAADEVKVPNFLQVSSVCIYAPEYNAPSREDYGFSGVPHPANAGYAEAKRDGERVATWSDLDHVVVVRPSNVFGPADYFDDKAHVIPALIKRVLGDEKTITLYGDPRATREFIYSTDAAMGMAIALARGENRGVYNVGTNGQTTISMLDLLKMIMDIVGNDKAILHDPAIGGGDSRRFSNARKLMSLGWKPQVGLEDGIGNTVEWYNGNGS